MPSTLAQAPFQQAAAPPVFKQKTAGQQTVPQKLLNEQPLPSRNERAQAASTPPTSNNPAVAVHDSVSGQDAGVYPSDVHGSTRTTSTAAITARQDQSAPPAKRRRIEATVPSPTTGNGNFPSENMASRSASILSGQMTSTKAIKSLTQSRRKQQLDATAAATVADASRGASAKVARPRENGNGIMDQPSAATSADTPVASIEESSGQIDGDNTPASTKSQKRYPKKTKQQVLQDTAAGIVEDAVQKASRDPKTRGRKKPRAATPEGAEDVVITASEIKMADLCRDTGNGKVSEREKQIRELQRVEILYRANKELREIEGLAQSEDRQVSETASERLERLGRQRDREESIAHNVPNTIIVNGQIQIDENSLQIDRHAAAAVDRAIENLPPIDENDLTRKVNSASWLRKDKSGGWNALLTERFYDGLRMFGTDFEMISKMFPGRTRHKVKLKFVKEEKLNHDRIKATLLGEKLPVDLPELEKMAGTEFDDPEELEKDMEEDRKRLEEEMLLEKEAMEETRREREAAVAAERAAVASDTNGEESPSKESRGHKGRKRGVNRKKGEPKNGEPKSAGKRAKKGTAAGKGEGASGTRNEAES